MSMRSHYCDQVGLNEKVNKRRDLGGLIFIDVRDRTGLVQVVFEPDNQQLHEKAATLRNEFCIKVTGIVKPRPDNQVNSNMKSGAIEVYASDLDILNKCAVLPLDFNQDNTEEQRLRYRYLDLRRPEMIANFTKRHSVTRFR